MELHDSLKEVVWLGGFEKVTGFENTFSFDLGGFGTTSKLDVVQNSGFRTPTKLIEIVFSISHEFYLAKFYFILLSFIKLVVKHIYVRKTSFYLFLALTTFYQNFDVSNKVKIFQKQGHTHIYIYISCRYWI